MNMRATLRVAQAGSNLQGNFNSTPEHKYTCPDVVFNLKLDTSVSNKDSVKRAISEFKENYQVWKPTVADTLIAASIVPRKVVNYVTEKEFTMKWKWNQIPSGLMCMIMAKSTATSSPYFTISSSFSITKSLLTNPYI
jgi:hypothetical protein